jgi:hypothetical protein
MGMARHGGKGMTAGPRRSECLLHGDEVREPWGSSFRGIEVVRCDHLGSAYVVEMFLLAGGEGDVLRSHHIHFVRDGRREVHALDEHLSPDQIDRIWASVVAAMERGDAPKAREARFHAHDV